MNEYVFLWYYYRLFEKHINIVFLISQKKSHRKQKTARGRPFRGVHCAWTQPGHRSPGLLQVSLPPERRMIVTRVPLGIVVAKQKLRFGFCSSGWHLLELDMVSTPCINHTNHPCERFINIFPFFANFSFISKKYFVNSEAFCIMSISSFGGTYAESCKTFRGKSGHYWDSIADNVCGSWIYLKPGVRKVPQRRYYPEQSGERWKVRPRRMWSSFGMIMR